jgi:hypothetical protein
VLFTKNSENEAGSPGDPQGPHVTLGLRFVPDGSDIIEEFIKPPAQVGFRKRGPVQFTPAASIDKASKVQLCSFRCVGSSVRSVLERPRKRPVDRWHFNYRYPPGTKRAIKVSGHYELTVETHPGVQPVVPISIAFGSLLEYRFQWRIGKGFIDIIATALKGVEPR